MKKLILLFIAVTFIGCASERKPRTWQQIVSPDKLNMQLHVNPNINVDGRSSHEIHQVRVGLDFNL